MKLTNYTISLFISLLYSNFILAHIEIYHRYIYSYFINSNDTISKVVDFDQTRNAQIFPQTHSNVGTFLNNLILLDSNISFVGDSTYAEVVNLNEKNIFKTMDAGMNDTICCGDTTQLQASGGFNYSWTPTTGLSNPNIANPLAYPQQTTTYYLTAQVLGPNLVNNGDFELGNVGFITGYTYCNTFNCLYPLTDYGYSVGTDAAYYHVHFTGIDHTTGTGNFMIINGGNPSLVVWKQTINVNPNTNYRFGSWLSTMIIGYPTGQIKFSINGTQLGPIYYAPSVVSQWDHIYIYWNSSSNTTATIEIFNVLPVGIGNDFGLDDIYFSELLTFNDSVVVTVNPLPAPIVTSNGTVCEGSSLSFTGLPNGMTNYSWSGPNGFTSSLQNPVVNNTTSVNSGLYSLTVSVNGCPSQTASLNVQVNPVPGTPVVSGNNPHCSGDTLLLQATSQNATNYLWTGPNGFTSTEQNPMINNITTSYNGVFTVIASNNGCFSNPSDITIEVDERPTTPLITSNSPICIGDTLYLFTSDSLSANFQWTGPEGFSSLNQNPYFICTSTANSGTYSLSVSINNCTSNPAHVSVLVLGNLPYIEFGNDTSVCSSYPLILNAASPGSSYIWNTGSANSEITITSTGEYSVTVTNSCGSASDSLNVTVKPSPLPPKTGNALRCGSGTLTLYASDGDEYYWYDASLGGNLVGTGPEFETPFLSLTDTFWVSNFNGICESSRKKVIAFIAPVPGTPHIIQIDSVTLKCDYPAISYEWKRDSTILPYNTQEITAAVSGYYSVKIRNAYNCYSAYSAPYYFHSLSIENPDIFEKIYLYPNPAEKIIYIEGSFSPNKKLILKIYNLTGALVDQIKFDCNTRSFNLDGKLSGCYIFEIHENENCVLKKLILIM